MDSFLKIVLEFLRPTYEYAQTWESLVISFVITFATAGLAFGLFRVILPCFLHMPYVPKDELEYRAMQYWTVHNKRYNLQAFVDRHPGGTEAIRLGRGRNCTVLFETYHSLADEDRVRSILEKYFVEHTKVGDADYECCFYWNETPFYDALKSKVRAHFTTTGQSHLAGTMQRVQLLFFCVGTVVCYWFFAHGSRRALFMLPFLYWWGPSSCMHDGGHFSLSRIPWVNVVCAHLGAAHMSYNYWSQQHTIAHHVYTNIVEKDPDMHHFSLLGFVWPGFRTSRDSPPPGCNCPGSDRVQAWCSRPKSWLQWWWWRLGVFIRVPLSTFGPSFIWSSLAITTGVFMFIVPTVDVSWETCRGHVVNRAVVAWLVLVQPVTYFILTMDEHHMGEILNACMLFLVVPYGIHGCIFYVFSQVSHIQAECFDANGSCCMATTTGEWAKHQVEHTHDYAVQSRLMLHISNGLNLQTVHHLFPQVAWEHYPEIEELLRETCDAFGIPRSSQPSFWKSLQCHFRYLHATNTIIDQSPIACAFDDNWELRVAGDFLGTAHGEELRPLNIQ